MPEELTSKQEATSPTSAGVLRSTCTFKWVHEFNLWMCLATTAEGNSCWACFCFLTFLCAQCCWHQRAGLGAAVSMLGQLWGFSVSELLYSRAKVSPSQKLLRRNVSILPNHCAPVSVSLFFPVSNRSICCSSMVPGTQPSIPPWSVQKSWKSKRSAFTPAMSKKSSRLGSASETEALVWWSSCVQSTVPTLPFPLC